MDYGKAKYIIILLALLFLGYFLSQVFSDHWVLPQTFNIGPLVIHYYGIIMAVAAASGFYLAIKRAPKYGVELKQAEDILFWLIVGGFIGARLYHVLSSFNYYYQNPEDIIKVWNGGLSIYGAVIGGFLTLLIVARILNVKSKILNVLDWLAPSLVLGQIVGRFGNLFNYEAFGYPTNLPWKMFVPVQPRPLAYRDFNFFQPFFLYEALGNLVILVILIKIIEPRTGGKISASKLAAGQNPSEINSNLKDGSLFFFYLLLYNTLRFALEFQRTDSTFIRGFRLNAVVSLVLVLCSVVALAFINKKENAQAP